MVSKCHLCAWEGHGQGLALSCFLLEIGVRDTRPPCKQRHQCASETQTAHSPGWGGERRLIQSLPSSGFPGVCLFHEFPEEGTVPCAWQ